jgi:hypothetical protein
MHRIPSSLKDTVDASGAESLQANKKPKRIFQGQTPGNEAFMVDRGTAVGLVKIDKRNREVLHPLLIGDDILSSPTGQPNRWAIDFTGIDQPTAQSYKLPFQRIASVLREREVEAKREAERNKELL